MAAQCQLVPADRWGSSARLPWWEIRLYIALWTGAALYTIYSVYIASIDYKDSLNDYFLVYGWRVLGREKDTSNFEWDFWSGWFLDAWPWFAGHLFLSHIFKKVITKHRDVVFTLYSLLAQYFLLGWPTVALFISHVLIMYLMTFTRSKVIIWVTSLSLLATLNLDVTVQIMKTFVQYDPYEKKFYLLLFALAMVNQHYTSAALEICAQRIEIHQLRLEQEEENKTKTRRKKVENVKDNPTLSYRLRDMFLYVFYLPLAFTGPHITFDIFHRQFYHKAHEKQLILPAFWIFLKRVSRLAFWILAIEYSLHFLYFNCIQLDISLLQKLPLWALAGVGYCQGQFFMVKYVVLFGVPSAIAAMDGLETPLGPKCISRIYLYSDMWKNFDRGLYGFLRKYIYIPLGGSRSGLLRQLLASFVCFIYVYFWHGGEDYQLVWVLLNFIGITLEAITWKISQIEQVRVFEQSWLSDASSRRFRGIVAIPLMAMSSIAIFTFFGGKQVGYTFFQRLIIDGFPVSTLTVSFVLYTCIQTSMETALWEKQKLKIN